MELGRAGQTAAFQWWRALRTPADSLCWSLAEWEFVVRSSRQLRLLARLAEALTAAGLIDRVPPQARRHLIAEQRLSRWRIASVRWTMERAAVALGDAPYPRVLLKGAAYLAQQLPIAAGRLPSDLDVLVPKAHLSDAQRRLVETGWTAKPLDDHDRRYYEEWSHELPPMSHPLLTVELDMHHGILPPVARTTVDTDMLLARVIPLPLPGWQVLAPLDQVLHSAAHLFFDSELRERLRDLADLDGLIRHFAAQPGFLHGLPARAQELGLQEPLALACHFCVHWFATPIPDDVLRAVEAVGPGRVERAWLLPLLRQVLSPGDPDDIGRPAQRAAANVLLMRHHFRRMPLRLLAPHLWHKFKAGRRLAAQPAPSADGA